MVDGDIGGWFFFSAGSLDLESDGLALVAEHLQRSSSMNDIRSAGLAEGMIPLDGVLLHVKPFLLNYLFPWDMVTSEICYRYGTLLACIFSFGG